MATRSAISCIRYKGAAGKRASPRSSLGGLVALYAVVSQKHADIAAQEALLSYLSSISSRPCVLFESRYLRALALCTCPIAQPVRGRCRKRRPLAMLIMNTVLRIPRDRVVPASSGYRASTVQRWVIYGAKLGIFDSRSSPMATETSVLSEDQRQTFSSYCGTKPGFLFHAKLFLRLSSVLGVLEAQLSHVTGQPRAS